MTTESQRAQPTILVVDDEEPLRTLLGAILELSGLKVTKAANVPEALHLIAAEPFDALLTDLCMPGGGDGLTVVRAMRNTHPKAVTLLYTGYPPLEKSMDSTLLYPDEILVKPMATAALVELIRRKLQSRGNRKSINRDRIAPRIAPMLEQGFC